MSGRIASNRYRGSHTSDLQQARQLAERAGHLLLRVRDDAGDADASELGERGDQASQAYLQRELSRLAPDDAVLSEEGADDPSRRDAERVWIIDPLDGTREFAEGRSDWAVHVALWCRGELSVGAVSMPAAGATYVSEPSPTYAPTSTGVLRLLVSHGRPLAVASSVARVLGAELVPMGSAGAKVMAVLRGEGDIYVHAGGQYEWDSAAPVVIARAAGLHASRLDGTSLVYNQPDPWQPELLVCRPELAQPVLDALRENPSD